ncbi:MAG: NERD domain-containing protein [Lachnospiraceae bacterium]|nr:NERD domain-containing protein [Lachnospiraceae bacterium]
MGFFDKMTGPVFLKEDSEAEKQLAALKEIQNQLSEENEILEREIKLVEAGIYGEKQIQFELENSHIPMYVLHDLYLEHKGLSAQIDYLVVTRKHIYVLECKNLYGNIEIDNKGNFIRSFSYGKKTGKEGIYSPITQNNRHLELIKAIRMETKTNILTRTLFEKGFDKNYRPIVVLANPKTVLNDKFAKKEIKNMVIRADQLVEYIKSMDRDDDTETMSEKQIEALARFFAEKTQNNPTDYVSKYREMVKIFEINTDNSVDVKVNEQGEDIPVCPKCGAKMILRTAKRGENIGKNFYGCSMYPKCKEIINI